MSAFDEFDVCCNILESLLTGVCVVGAGENFVLTRHHLPKLKEQLQTWANAARRVMHSHGIRLDQLTQVRGFADQRLRKPDAPLGPANRRISVIEQYIIKSNDDKAPSDETAPKNNRPATAESKPVGLDRHRPIRTCS